MQYNPGDLVHEEWSYSMHALVVAGAQSEHFITIMLSNAEVVVVPRYQISLIHAFQSQYSREGTM